MTKMTKKAEKALKASIKKWEEHLKAENASTIILGTENCPLCVVSPDNCAGCPVDNKTGTGCCGSPYFNASRTRYRWASGHETREDWQTACQAEIDFLKGLLP